MSDPQPPQEGHPILSGLAALVGVTLAIGAILGGAALVGSKAAGLDGASARSTSSADQTLYLPPPSPTGTPTAPNVTIAPGTDPSIPVSTGSPTQIGGQISLSVAGTSFAAGQRIDLTGTYPAGEGVRLEVQRLEGTTWEQFADVTAGVSGGTFGTYIMTSRTGETQLRMYDPTADLASNTVSLTIT